MTSTLDSGRPTSGTTCAARRGTAVLLMACLLPVACKRSTPPQREKAPREATSSTPSPSTAILPARGQVAETGLEYVELVTGGAAEDDTLPLIVAIHGLGDRPQGFGRLFTGFPEPARIVLPRAPDPHFGGFSWFAFDRADEERTVRSLKAAAERLARFIESYAGRRPTRGKPIVSGFSQGGMLSFTLAVHHPRLVGAAIPLAGWLPPSLWPEARATSDSALPALVALHGTGDTVIPVEPTRRAVEHLQELGFTAEIREFPSVPHSVPEPMQQALFELLGEACRSQPAN